MADNFEIHTVSFLGGQQPPEFVLPQPQAQGPPRLLLNPRVARPTTSKTYSGTGYGNSGVLYPPAAPASLPKRFSLTFTRKGRHEYWCIVHVSEGMKGVIVVE
jgi:plastocyanin